MKRFRSPFYTSVILACVTACPASDLVNTLIETAGRESPALAHEREGERLQVLGKYEDAEKEYRLAASLDPRYAISIIPLLDEEGRGDEIIAMLDSYPERMKLPEFLLGPLMSAYHARKEWRAAADIEAELVRREGIYGRDDYRNYILAYASLWAADSEKCLKYLGRIKSKRMLSYVKTSSKFASISTRKEFVALIDERLKQN